MNRRGVTRGAIGVIPDATLSLRDASDQMMTLTVELVTDSYTKDMTPEQRDAFRAASEDVLFYADTPSTAQRVALVRGETCSCV